jgi:cytochrome c553
MGDRWLAAGMRIALGCLLVTAGFRMSVSNAAEAPAFSSAQIDFFETKVRPILATTCQKCHGAKTQKGGLRLDSRAAALKGGESGPAIVSGKPNESPMIEAINYRGLEMPPSGRLKDREIAALTEWVKMGTPWPKEQPPAADSRPGDFKITAEDRRYWAYQPIGNPRPPKVRRTEWVANPIDAFVLDRLEKKGLDPNPPANARTLIRRLFFDLIGLPPTPEEVRAFVADHSASAYERLVDGLLARPQYGERWGRHWLDVARFAQTNGYERDAEKPDAWRYRDYVIQTYNEDKPYNRFILEQLAGDELDDLSNDSIIATGFYRLGIWDDEPDDKRVAAWDEIDEMVRTTGSAFLGLTLGCARCHNHMFDPIPQQDYYQFAAFFRNVEPYGTPTNATHLKGNGSGILTPLLSPHQFSAWKSHQVEFSQKIAVIKARPEVEQKQQAKELKRLEEEYRKAPFPHALSVRECGGSLKETHMLVRGNVATPGKKVGPRWLTILGGQAPDAIPVSFDGATANKPLRTMLADLGVKPTLGLRRRLAQWIADENNPLTGRVMMNRLWQEHFGRGIVGSSDNFGRAGTPPTHPELLAWLARDFIDGGWRIKRMQKQIVMSNAYRMSSSAVNSRAAAVDVENNLLWRQNLRRLDAEAIRDAMLAVSGKLNLEAGGRGIFPKLSKDVLETQSMPGFGWGKSSTAEESRRSIYIYLKRTLMVPFLETFDYTNTAESVGVRPVTTVAPQALLLLNSEFTFQEAAALAARVTREAGTDRAKQIDRLFCLAIGRSPTPKETAIASDLPLRSLCLAVLNLNEFIYID